MGGAGWEPGGCLPTIYRADIRIRDDRKPVIRSGLLDKVAESRESTALDDDGVGKSANYQVTSPAPARALAALARVNRRSERRFR